MWQHIGKAIDPTWQTAEPTRHTVLEVYRTECGLWKWRVIPCAGAQEWAAGGAETEADAKQDALRRCYELLRQETIDAGAAIVREYGGGPR